MFASVMLHGWEMSNFVTSIINLVYCCSRSVSCHGKGKGKRRDPASLLKSTKQFSVASPSSGLPSLEAAREINFENSGARRSVRGRRNVPVVQGDKDNILLVYILIDFEIVVSFNFNLFAVTVLLT